MFTRYHGEFGYELISVIPYAYWLHKRGRLTSTQSCADTRCLYYFSTHHVEVDIPRAFVIPSEFPISNVHAEHIDTSMWTPPPYREYYAPSAAHLAEKPCPSVVISNKFQEEWDAPPVNYITPAALDSLVGLLVSNGYGVCYNRPTAADIVTDNSALWEMDDFAVIESYRKKFGGRVTTMQRVHARSGCHSFNLTQMLVMAASDLFISVQGGNAVLASYFGKTNIVYAVQGREISNGYNVYKNWYGKLSGCDVRHVASYGDLICEVKEVI